MNGEDCEYGVGDCSYNAAGGIAGLIQLVDSFYGFMDALPEAKIIRGMHRVDLAQSRLRLAYFLSGWLGGPNLYAEKIGSINIPLAHRHLAIGAEERDAWLLCMRKAVDEQPCKESFKNYLIEQLSIPAERIKIVCASNNSLDTARQNSTGSVHNPI